MLRSDREPTSRCEVANFYKADVDANRLDSAPGELEPFALHSLHRRRGSSSKRLVPQRACLFDDADEESKEYLTSSDSCST